LTRRRSTPSVSMHCAAARIAVVAQDNRTLNASLRAQHPAGAVLTPTPTPLRQANRRRLPGRPLSRRLAERAFATIVRRSVASNCPAEKRQRRRHFARGPFLKDAPDSCPRRGDLRALDAEKRARAICADIDRKRLAAAPRWIVNPIVSAVAAHAPIKSGAERGQAI